MLREIILLLIFFGQLRTELCGQNYERYKKLIDTSLYSKQLGYTKTVTITVPIEWQEKIEGDFPLIVIFDQQNQRSHNYILNTIDYLTSNEQLPSSILVSITSNSEFRYLETTLKKTDERGLALENEYFLFDELIPLLKKQYKASSFKIIIGHSRYAFFASSLFLKRINELNAVIAISPFFSQKNINLIDSVANIQKQKFNSHKYFRFSVGDDFPSDYYKMDSVIKGINTPYFNAKGFLFKEAGHNVTPGLTVGISLYEIFEIWAACQNKYMDKSTLDIHAIDSLENEISNFYGNRLKFSIGTLNGKGWFFYNERQYEKAIKVWELLIQKYPNFSEAYVYIIDAKIQLKKDYLNDIDELKNSLKFSDFYNEEAKQEIMEKLKEMIK